MRPNKRDELVQQALKIFYRGGFHATGMDLLVAETGISKTSMYKHFRTKEDLIVAALQLRNDLFRNWMWQRMEALADTPRGQLLAMFDVLKEWFEQPEFKGCMFINATAEYQDMDHPIHIQADHHKRLLFEKLRTIASAAGAVDPPALARGLLLLKEGAIVTAQIGHSDNPAGDARRAAETLIAAAIPRAAG